MPSRPIVIRDLSIEFTNNVVDAFGRQAGVLAVVPGNTLVSFQCMVPAGTRTCTSAGPSGVIPASTRLVFLVSNGFFSTETAGTDALFSWHASAP